MINNNYAPIQALSFDSSTNNIKQSTDGLMKSGLLASSLCGTDHEVKTTAHTQNDGAAGKLQVTDSIQQISSETLIGQSYLPEDVKPLTQGKVNLESPMSHGLEAIKTGLEMVAMMEDAVHAVTSLSTLGLSSTIPVMGILATETMQAANIENIIRTKEAEIQKKIDEIDKRLEGLDPAEEEVKTLMANKKDLEKEFEKLEGLHVEQKKYATSATLNTLSLTPVIGGTIASGLRIVESNNSRKEFVENANSIKARIEEIQTLRGKLSNHSALDTILNIKERQLQLSLIEEERNIKEAQVLVASKTASFSANVLSYVAPVAISGPVGGIALGTFSFLSGERVTRFVLTNHELFEPSLAKAKCTIQKRVNDANIQRSKKSKLKHKELMESTASKQFDKALSIQKEYEQSIQNVASLNDEIANKKASLENSKGSFRKIRLRREIDETSTKLNEEKNKLSQLEAQLHAALKSGTNKARFVQKKMGLNEKLSDVNRQLSNLEAKEKAIESELKDVENRYINTRLKISLGYSDEEVTDLHKHIGESLEDPTLRKDLGKLLNIDYRPVTENDLITFILH